MFERPKTVLALERSAIETGLWKDLGNGKWIYLVLDRNQWRAL
jgi:hypothetical protein